MTTMTTMINDRATSEARTRLWPRPEGAQTLICVRSSMGPPASIGWHLGGPALFFDDSVSEQVAFQALNLTPGPDTGIRFDLRYEPESSSEENAAWSAALMQRGLVKMSVGLCPVAETVERLTSLSFSADLVSELLDPGVEVTVLIRRQVDNHGDSLVGDAALLSVDQVMEIAAPPVESKPAELRLDFVPEISDERLSYMLERLTPLGLAAVEGRGRSFYEIDVSALHPRDVSYAWLGRPKGGTTLGFEHRCAEIPIVAIRDLSHVPKVSLAEALASIDRFAPNWEEAGVNYFHVDDSDDSGPGCRIGRHNWIPCFLWARPKPTPENDLTWTCSVCHETRPDAMISVVSHEINSSTTLNARYCNDRTSCATMAQGVDTAKIASMLEVPK